jgi:hypothetical protein
MVGKNKNKILKYTIYKVKNCIYLYSDVKRDTEMKKDSRYLPTYDASFTLGINFN